MNTHRDILQDDFEPHEHPLRNASLHVFRRIDHDGIGTAFVARFHPYDNYPLVFRGPTKDGVVESAEAFRTETVEKHANDYASIAAGRAKKAATLARKKRKAAK